MSHPDTPYGAAPVSQDAAALSPRAALIALLMRLHFYIGLFVGPFIFMAALTGTLYALTPQIENHLYARQLFSDSRSQVQPLSRQISAARSVIGARADIWLSAVRPAAAGETTRVMFASDGFGPSESRAIFIDPVNLAVRGDLMVYGTSGVLPLRTWLDYLHRSLLLPGDIGRNYSELAASWLWVAALGGVLLWWMTRTRGVRSKRASARSRSAAGRRVRLRGRHSIVGLLLLPGLIFFSATGLTWSQWAGGNISAVRNMLEWQTPDVNTLLAAPETPMHEHEHEHHHTPSASGQAHPPAPAETFDAVLAQARMAGIDAEKVEIRPAAQTGRAWRVTEIDRRWPTQVDAAAIDPTTLAVVDKTDFSRFPLAAKLTRWGVDAHMGVLFGWLNQLVLVLFGAGLCVTIIWGYRMWWLKRPRHGNHPNPARTLTAVFLRSPFAVRLALPPAALLLGWFLPVMGFSLLVFLLLDVARWALRRRRGV